ncbi:hypothetical protein MYU51_000561 [Penicillium brevicompactum]|uniref:uncharacterized protein n=1 Tax=Penicillium brevicompactum TaxID=5074 RepID=UPI002541E11C|nr:uncharacterized protein N7506_008792 [Penicillium brevicompactum]KAJ5325690.1 hypothetical protein N7506_008792 [Penicillium brevicompactum]
MKPFGIATMLKHKSILILGLTLVLLTVGVSALALDLPALDQVKPGLIHGHRGVHPRALPPPTALLDVDSPALTKYESVKDNPKPVALSSGPDIAHPPLSNLEERAVPMESSTFGGDMTWYDTGLGSCGWWNNANDHICAISQVLYNRTNVDGNANHNPVCGKRIHLQRGDRGIDVAVADNCPGCSEFSIDVTTSVFQALGNLDEGRVRIEWHWI